MAGTYTRGSGDHVAERVRPIPGSDEEKQLNALVADESNAWTYAPDAEPEPSEPKQPAKAAAKEVWVAWAVHSGADQAEAEVLTKDQLIETYGGGGS